MTDYRATYRAKHPERVKESARRWREKNREHTNAYAREYQKNRLPKEVSRARNAVERAVRSGVLIPKPCEECGSQFNFSDGRSAVHAHHKDYSKQLEVTWLCYRCHAAEHARTREEMKSK